MALTWGDVTRRRNGVHFTLQGVQFSVPASPAYVWLEAIDSRDPESVLPGLLSRDEWPAWSDVILSRDLFVSPHVLSEMTRVVVSHAAGMPYAPAMRLVATAINGWRFFDGRASARGVDLLELPLDRFLNTMLVYVFESLDEKKMLEVETKLTAPLPGVIPHELEAPWGDENEQVSVDDFNEL